jgi:hypothetical protein
MNQLDLSKIRWYHKFSYWMFIWFILYKIGIISYQPSFIYILSIIIIIYYIIVLSIHYKTKSVNKLVLFIRFIILLCIDLIPLILLYPYKFDYKTLILNVIFLIIYLIYMNQPIMDTFNMYLKHFKYTNMKSLDKYLKYLQYFFGFN